MATDVASALWPNMVTLNIHIFLLQLLNFSLFIYNNR